MSGNAKPPLLLRLQLAAYAAPALPIAALALPLYLVVPTFYAEALGLPLATIGTVLLIARILDALLDPVTGFVADNWPNKSRRKFWLIAVSLPLALAAFALFWPPANAGILWLGIFAVAVSLGYTAIVLPYWALGAELSNDYNERNSIAAWREGFALVGTIAAIALPFSIGWNNPDQFHGLALIAMAVGLGLPAAVGLLVWIVKEPVADLKAQPSPLKAIRALADNPYFLRLLAAFLFNSLANALPATLFLLFVEQRLGAGEWRGPLLILYFVCAIAGMPLWNALAARWSKHRVWCVAMLAACAIFLPTAFLGTGDVAAFTVICVLSGICLGADLVLPASMQADVIEAGRSSGGGEAAFYFAAWALVTKLALALAVGIAFPVLAAFGFDAIRPQLSSPQSLQAISVLYALLPVVLKLVAIAIMWHFKLDRQELEAIRVDGRQLRPAPVILATSGKYSQ